jgi:hypothetical protein
MVGGKQVDADLRVTRVTCSSILASWLSLHNHQLVMPPKNKAKAAGVSASSFLDLKAELSKHEEEFAKNKDAGKSTAIAIGGTGSKVRTHVFVLC